MFRTSQNATIQHDVLAYEFKTGPCLNIEILKRVIVCFKINLCSLITMALVFDLKLFLRNILLHH